MMKRSKVVIPQSIPLGGTPICYADIEVEPTHSFGSSVVHGVDPKPST